MERFGRANPHVRPLPRPGRSGSYRPGCVGTDLEMLGRRLEVRRPADVVTAYTVPEIGGGFALLAAPIIGYGTAIVGLYRNVHNARFGTLTVGDLFGSTVAISLNHLRAHSGLTLDELAHGPLAPLFAYVLNHTVQIVTHDAEAWREFAACSGFRTPEAQEVVDVRHLVRVGINDGRVDPGKRTPRSAEECIAALAYTYLGRSEDVMTEAEYASAYPGAPYPPQRRRKELYHWPCSTPDSDEHYNLHQTSLFANRDRAIASGIADLVFVTVGSAERRFASFHLAQAVKSTLRSRIRVSLEAPAGGPIECRIVADMTMLGVDADTARRLMDQELLEVRVTFGGTFPQPGSVEAPAAHVIIALADGGTCKACGWAHAEGQECDLARRLRANEVPNAEVNCMYCRGHDHYRRACPLLHYRCKRCHLLGHTERTCKWRSVEYRFRLFMQHCRDGRFTGIERRGPMRGPLGFGVHAPLTLRTADHEWVASIHLEIHAVYRDTGRSERRLYGRFVAQNPAPVLNVVNLPEKTIDQSWTDHLLPYARLLRDASRSPVYRGTAIALIPGGGGPAAVRAMRAPEDADRAALENRDRGLADERSTVDRYERAAAARREAPGDETMGADDWAAARRQTGKRPLGFRESLTGDEVPSPLPSPRGLVRAGDIGRRVDLRSGQRSTAAEAPVIEVEEAPMPEAVDLAADQTRRNDRPAITNVVSLRRCSVRLDADVIPLPRAAVAALVPPAARPRTLETSPPNVSVENDPEVPSRSREEAPRSGHKAPPRLASAVPAPMVRAEAPGDSALLEVVRELKEQQAKMDARVTALLASMEDRGPTPRDREDAPEAPGHDGDRKRRRSSPLDERSRPTRPSEGGGTLEVPRRNRPILPLQSVVLEVDEDDPVGDEPEDTPETTPSATPPRDAGAISSPDPPSDATTYVEDDPEVVQRRVTRRMARLREESPVPGPSNWSPEPRYKRRR